MKKTVSSWILLIVCNLIWSLQFTCIKLTQDQVGPYFTVWCPLVLATVFLAPFVLKDFRKRGKNIKDILVFGQLALLGVFPAQVLMTWGTQYSLASNAAILSLSLPVITAVFAYFMLNERMNRVRWASLVIAVIGVILCSTGDITQMDFGSNYAIGNLLIFLAVIGNSYYNVGIKKKAQQYTELEMLFYTYVGLVILLTPLVFYYEFEVFARIPEFTSQTWTGMALLTVFHNFLSMILFFKALKVLDAMQVALSNYLIPFMGLAVVAIWLNEQLSLQTIVGGLLVFTATLIVTVIDYKMSRHRTNLLRR